MHISIEKDITPNNNSNKGKQKEIRKVKKIKNKLNKGANYFLTTQSSRECGTKMNDMREIYRK
jgi:hypothetical protein